MLFLGLLISLLIFLQIIGKILMFALLLFITLLRCLLAVRDQHLCHSGSKIRQLLPQDRFLREHLGNRILSQFFAFDLDNTFFLNFQYLKQRQWVDNQNLLIDQKHKMQEEHCLRFDSFELK